MHSRHSVPRNSDLLDPPPEQEAARFLMRCRARSCDGATPDGGLDAKDLTFYTAICLPPALPLFYSYPALDI